MLESGLLHLMIAYEKEVFLKKIYLILKSGTSFVTWEDVFSGINLKR